MHRYRPAVRVSLLRWIPLLALLAYFGLGMAHIRHASLTFDEGPHLAIGYATLKTADFRLQPVHIHPPLANIIAAAPLLLQNDLPNPEQIDGWEISSLSAVTDTVVWQYAHPRRIATAARVPILLMGLLLGAVVYRWAKQIGGLVAGTIAVVLYSFDPACIAHGSLVTTDMAATLLIVATLYTAAQAIQRGRKQRLHDVLTGALLGLAQLAKVSSLSLIPIVALVMIGDAWHAGQGQHTPRRLVDLVARAILLFGSAALVVWAGYGFQMEPALGLPFPIPWGTHLRIYESLQEHYALGHATFAAGQISTHGWAWYFPLAFAIKTPIPTLLLTVGSLLSLGLRRAAGPLTGHKAITLVIFPITYAVSSLFSSVNIGYRHLLPLLPFIFIGCGALVAKRLFAGSPVRKHLRWIGLAGAIGWLVIGTLVCQPHPLTFFNEIAGGPSHGYRYLVDSNLDWGQNLWDLRTWMERNDVDEINYAHYSPARLDVYGIQATLLPPDPRAGPFTPWTPAPGIYAIGATVLQGAYAPDLNTYAWFRDREPIARLGNALFIYRIEPETAPSWVVLCATTGQSTESVRTNLGQPGRRVLQPDCSPTQVYPPGSGLIVRSSDNRLDTGGSGFALRAASGEEIAVITRVETSPTPAFPLPMPTTGPLDFLGYDLAEMQSGAALEIRTYWRAREIPGRPLSLMAHLVAPDGTTLEVGDSMGYSIDQWQPDDIIVQQHSFVSPSDQSLKAHIGAYWLDTMERWSWGTEQDRDHWEVRVDTAIIH